MTVNVHVVRSLVVFNVALFTIALCKITWHHQPRSSHDDPAAASINDVHPSSHRSLLRATEPRPCECKYNVKEGEMERVDPMPVPLVAPAPLPGSKFPSDGPSRSKIGDDIIPGEEFQVPNIVHYIWFNTESKPLQFHHMLSVLSAHKVLQPEVIMFHTDTPPSGPYWEQITALPTLKVMKRAPPVTLFNETVQKPYFYTSHSNVARVEILREYGGIYLDFDVLVVRPFTELRRHVCTIGYESDHKACGSIIVCSQRAFFLDMWINAYLDDYRMEEWAYNTGKVPFKLSKRFPYLVHVEETKLNRPNFQELDVLWGPRTWAWRENYAVHTWYRLWKDKSPYFHDTEPDMDNIKTWNSTFGEIARSILFGKAEIMHLEN